MGLTTAVPDAFAATVTSGFGQAGAAWLDALPQLLAACRRRWSLTLGRPFPLSYNYVLPARRADGAELVLKCGVVNPELLCEIEALRLYDGRGAVQLIDADPAWGVLLLERLRPGTTLLEVEDDLAATAVAAETMQRLWRPLPPDHPFPTAARWAAGLERMRRQFDGGTGPLPAELVALAEALFADLLPTMAEPLLLHGDLHHKNILATQRGTWLAIDPKGLAGEPAYEVGAWLRNPLPELLQRPNPARVLARRVDLFSERLGVERERVVGWGVAQAVLSAWWSVEDHGRPVVSGTNNGGWEPAIACARLLAGLLG